MGEVIGRRQDTEEERPHDDSAPRKRVGEVAADESADHAADHENHEKEPRCVRILTAVDKEEREERSKCTVCPAAQPHREVQRNRRTGKEDVRELRRMCRCVFGQGGDGAEPRAQKQHSDQDRRKEQKRKSTQRKVVEEGDKNQRDKRHARVPPCDEAAHHPVSAPLCRRPSDEHGGERMIRRNSDARHGDNEEEECRMRYVPHQTHGSSGGRHEPREERAEVPPIHHAADDGLEHIRRHRRDHDEYAAHRQGQTELRHEKREQNGQKVSIEVHHPVSRREQCRRMAYLIFHLILPPVIEILAQYAKVCCNNSNRI